MTDPYVKKDSYYLEYTRIALEEYETFDDQRKNMLVDQVWDFNVRSVLDVGCGAGQLLLPFAEKIECLCVGVDVAAEVGQVGREVFRRAGLDGKAFFLPAAGENLPFADESFDVVICRVALPYMDNRRALAEMARVLGPGGKMFLKIHAPAFYLWMLKQRLPSISLKQLAYPIICLAGGTLNLLSGKHPEGAFWKGKEVYQTKRFLERELAKHDLKIVSLLPDTNTATPSFLIEKSGSPNLGKINEQ